jgi:hypothetical protein
MSTQPTWKDPKRLLLVAAALAPFVVATLYMSLKPAPRRLQRTHPPAATAPAHEGGPARTP